MAGDLADKIDVADIDSELKRSGRNQDLDLASFQAPFCIQPQAARKRAVMRRHIFDAKPLCECK